MPKQLPEVFIHRLREIIPPQAFDIVNESFRTPRPLSVRINTLKIDGEKMRELLASQGLKFKDVPWSDEAVVIATESVEDFLQTDFMDRGLLYRQGLSSMLPALALEIEPGMDVLDMCAAPGSKTTQLAALMQNDGTLVALDVVRGRYYKLKTVCDLLGVDNVTTHCLDARRYQSRGQLFDRILVDAPCSSEGRFHVTAPKTYAYWSERKIKEMVHKQRGLLLSASRLLKPGGILLYSTCTFAPEENEGIMDWFLRKTKEVWTLEDIEFSGVSTYPAVHSWREKTFTSTVSQCCRVLPGDEMEGFFMAKLVKQG